MSSTITCGFHQFSFSNKLFGGIANYHQRHVDILLVLPMTYFSWPGCVAMRMIPNLLICLLTWCSIIMWWISPSILICTHHFISRQQISVAMMMSMHSIDLMESYSVYRIHTYVSDHFGIISCTFNYRCVIKHCLRISFVIFLNC